MTFRVFLCVALLVLSTLSTAAFTPPKLDACLTRSQRCCYSYYLCGQETQKSAASSTCLVKRCGAECVTLCKHDHACKKKCAAEPCVKFSGACRTDVTRVFPRFCPRLTCGASKDTLDAGVTKPTSIVDEKQVKETVKRSTSVFKH